MKYILPLILLSWLTACQTTSSSLKTAERQIIETLKDETRYFCERNLSKWAAQWSHASYASKMYGGDTDFALLSGWEAIWQHTVDHIREYPEPIEVPEVEVDYHIEYFGKTAWVFYTKKIPQGMAREARFMVREKGVWKIARMQTIYLITEQHQGSHL